jgi:hypothetical protein
MPAALWKNSPDRVGVNFANCDQLPGEASTGEPVALPDGSAFDFGLGAVGRFWAAQIALRASENSSIGTAEHRNRIRDLPRIERINQTALGALESKKNLRLRRHIGGK